MPNHQRFREFVRDMTHLVARDGIDEATILDGGTGLLSVLIEHDDWLPDEFAVPSDSGYRQYLLHCDPLERFSVVSFVWRPGQRTPVHDHLTWGLVGQLRGEELCDEYVPRATGGFEHVGGHRMRRGEIDRVSPTVGDVHAVSNVSEETSVSIHVYGVNIGMQRRHVFDASSGITREFVSGYHNPTVPNFWIQADARSS